MLSLALILLSLVLVGVVGLQFTYMFYLDRVQLERKSTSTTWSVDAAALTHASNKPKTASPSKTLCSKLSIPA